MKNLEVALGIARRAIFKTGQDEGLKDRLLLTAVENDGKVYYRPYAAAGSWLRANPKWIVEAKGLIGAKYADLQAALNGLAEDQARLDGALGLVIPAHLQDAKNDGPSSPGPSFASWR